MRNLKRALSLAVASVMLLGMMVVGSGASYVDVSSADNVEAIEVMQAVGVMVGDDQGNFNGEDPITREEMAKILCQAKQLKVTVPEKTYADDAEIAEWAKGYVYACQEAGIMEGSGDNFNPRDNATRAEGAAVLVRAFA